MTGKDPSKATLSDPQGRRNQGAAPDSTGWPRLLVLLNLGVLACLVVFLVQGSLSAPQPAGPIPEELKAAAVALEERGLDAPAAAAWQSYLDAVPEDPERAEILYHVGQLRMQAEQFDQAAGAFVRAELAAGENKELAGRIGPRLIECLRGMGRYGEVSRELARRVEAGAKKSDDGEVVATIGEVKITEADLDRMVERHVDQMLAAQGIPGDRVRRLALLRQLSSPNFRAQVLHEFVQKELFIRRARELRLDQDDDFLLAREQSVDNLLLRKLQSHELRLSPPTDADLEAFYQEHQAEYRQPESLGVLGIRVADEKAAAAVLEKIKSAADFRKQAQQIRQSGSADGEMTFTRTLFRGQVDPVLGNTDALLALSEDQWTGEPIVRGDHALLVLVETKAAARTPSLAEMKQYVQRQYIRQKQRQALDKLFRKLTARYDVDIKLAAQPEQIPEFSQAGRMLAEPGSAAAKPETPPAKPGETTAKPQKTSPKPQKPSPKPQKPTPKPQKKPDNPLRDPDSPAKPPVSKEKTPPGKTSAGKTPG